MPGSFSWSDRARFAGVTIRTAVRGSHSATLSSSVAASFRRLPGHIDVHVFPVSLDDRRTEPRDPRLHEPVVQAHHEWNEWCVVVGNLRHYPGGRNPLGLCSRTHELLRCTIVFGK